MHITIWDAVKWQANTCYTISKFLKSPNSINLLNVLLDAISCMNGKEMIILSMDGKEKQKAEEENKL